MLEKFMCPKLLQSDVKVPICNCSKILQCLFYCFHAAVVLVVSVVRNRLPKRIDRLAGGRRGQLVFCKQCYGKLP